MVSVLLTPATEDLSLNHPNCKVTFQRLGHVLKRSLDHNLNITLTTQLHRDTGEFLHLEVKTEFNNGSLNVIN